MTLLLTALPLGFLIGMSPLWQRAFNPFIQILKPISPLAWMPLALYTIKDSSLSGMFVIFICALWPMLMNTAFGVASVRRDDGRPEAALEPHRRALELEPTLAEARAGFGFGLVLTGRVEEGLTELEQAVREAPRHAGIRGLAARGELEPQ